MFKQREKVPKAEEKGCQMETHSHRGIKSTGNANMCVNIEDFYFLFLNLKTQLIDFKCFFLL